MANNKKSKTPEEYISGYTDKLQTELANYDIQINKLGVIGFLLNILGWTQYDSKNYYDNLFKEGFVATAQEEHNLYLHSYIYGYQPGFATASTAFGNFSFDFQFMNKRPGNIVKREVAYSNIVFKIGNYTFITDSVYRFIEDGGNYYCIIYDNTGGVRFIPSASSNIQAPFVNVQQLTNETRKINVQSYDFGTYYPYEFEVNEGYLTDLTVDVSKTGLDEASAYNKFEVKSVKHFENAFTDSCFLRSLSTSKFLLEFGSGIRGSYIPSSKVKLGVYTTFGKEGNLNVEKNPIVDNKVKVITKQYKEDKTWSNVGGNYKKLLNINFKYSEGGEDPLSGDDLRQRIVEHIQTRDTLITEKDYYNIAKIYLDDFKFLFRKSSFVDNIFYLLRNFRDKYQNPVASTNWTQQLILDYEQIIILIGDPALDGILEAGTYNYYVYATDNFGNTVKSNTIGVVVDGTSSNAVSLTWGAVPNAVKYRVFGRPDADNNYHIWETYDTTLLDTGESSDIYVPITSEERKLSFYPTYKIGTKEFISPFIYEYDNYMDWYKGYVLHDNFLVYFDNLSDRNPAYDIPVFYFNIVYDRFNHKTFVRVKSHQDITDYDLKIDINGLNLFNLAMSFIDENTWEYVYTDVDHGIIWDKISLRLDVNTLDGDHLVTGQTSDFTQIEDISDSLKLFRYKHTDTTMYITNVPIIDYEVYYSDTEYYLQKFIAFLNSNSFKENRLITDELQFRFLNNHIIPAYYLQYIMKQGYNSFDLEFPLKLSVTAVVDTDYVEKEEININNEKNILMSELAALLQTDYSGIAINYYNSQIVDYVHTNRLFFKSVTVEITDATGIVIENGLENNTDEDILKSILTDETVDIADRKLYAFSYVPTYYHWDLDNIELTVLF